MRRLLMTAMALWLMAVCASAHADVIYNLDFNHDSIMESLLYYTPSGTETVPVSVPKGVSSSWADYGAPSGNGIFNGYHMTWMAQSAAWANHTESYKFGFDGTLYPGTNSVYSAAGIGRGPIIGAYTIETRICAVDTPDPYGWFGLTQYATLLDSVISGTGLRLRVDQVNQRIVFEPDVANPSASLSASLPDYTWHTIKAVVNPTLNRTELWMDGTLQATGAYSSSYVVPGYFAVGAPYQDSVTGQNYHGYLDSLTISGDIVPPPPATQVFYNLDLNHDATSTSELYYTPSMSETVPSSVPKGVSSFWADYGYGSPNGSFNGAHMTWLALSAAWPNHTESYKFGFDGTLYPGTNSVYSAAGIGQGPIIGGYTIETHICPVYSAASTYGLTNYSTLVDAVISGTGMRLRADQVNQKIMFEPDVAYPSASLSASLPDYTWHTIKAVVNPIFNRTELWVDGTLQATGAYSSSYVIPGYFAVGAPYQDSVTGQNYFGYLDSLKISGVPLTELPTTPVIYSLGFNHDNDLASLPTYTPDSTEIVPASVPEGVSSSWANNGVGSGNGIIQGNYAMAWLVQSAAWPNHGESYKFGFDGNLYPGTNATYAASGIGRGPWIGGYTIGARIEPNYTPDSYGWFGLTQYSTLLDSVISGTGLRLRFGRVNQKLVFEPDVANPSATLTSNTIPAGASYEVVAAANPTLNRTELWVNGALQATGAYSLAYVVPGYFAIGAPYDDRVTAQNFSGTVDWLTIRGVPLTAPPLHQVYYNLNFDRDQYADTDTDSQSQPYYYPSSTEAMPSSVPYGVSTYDPNPNPETLSALIKTPNNLIPIYPGPQGGNVMQFLRGAKYPNHGESYKFGVDGALYPGAIGKYAGLQKGPVIAGAYTIEALVLPDYTPGSYGLTQYSTLLDSVIGGTGLRLRVDQVNQKFVFEPDVASPTATLTSTSTLVSGRWYHVAAVVNQASDRTELWINGVMEATGTYNSAFSIPGYFQLGAPYDESVTAHNFQGLVDALAISDMARSAASFVLPSYPPIPAGTRAANFGKTWVRTHPFQLFGWTVQGASYLLDSGKLNTFQQSNMNTAWLSLSTMSPMSRTTAQDLAVINAASAAGLGWHGAIGSTDVPMVAARVSAVTSAGDDNCYDIAEEAQAVTLPQVGYVADWLRTYRPNALCYVNAFTESSYLNSLFAFVNPDVVMYDIYPFNNDGSTNLNGLFSTLTSVRQAGLQHGVPYWAWVQAFTSVADNYTRMPSESEMRMQEFSCLTGGYTGIGYFIYDSNSGAGFQGLVGATPTSQYSYVQSMNPEITKLGQSLRFLTSSDLRFVPGTGHSAPTGLTNWGSGAGADSHINNVQVNAGQTGTYKDGLIGFFTDDAGQKYFMLTNLYHDPNLLSSQTTLSITVTFDSTISSLLRLNRTTGQQEVVNLTNNTLTLTLPGGTGDLFKYNNGVPFVGVEPSLPSVTVGANNKAVRDAIMTQAAPNYMWVLWGKVSNRTASGFDIDDGSGVVIHVNGENTISDGDYVSVRGTLVVGGTPTLTSYGITKYN